MDLRTGFWSLFAPINKTKGNTNNDSGADGVVKEYDELELNIEDSELIMLSLEYESSWNSSESHGRVHNQGDTNERYWKGKKDEGTNKDQFNDKTAYYENIVFEATETFLPLATQKNPDPLVKTSNTQKMQDLAGKITSAVTYLADINNLKLMAQETVRNWLNRYVGVIKIGWDGRRKEIVYKVIHPTALILDPNGYVEAGRYYGEFLGEKKEDKARNLIAKFPKKKEQIEMACNGKLGSILKYKEWWTPEYIFFTYKDIVLDKAKHPHWNYEGETTTVDEYGHEFVKATPGKNHFDIPEYPYAFLTVFSLQKSPVDEVTLIEQGRMFQDLINERGKQLTKNIRGTNAGAIVSGQVFTKEQAAQVGDALREGRTIRVPVGDINQAYKRDVSPALPPYVYQSMQDYRNRFLDMFGIRGSTPQGTESEDTVRGKIIVGNQDNSRIGGGITNHLECMISYLYNYTLQMIYVYYDLPHTASVIGANGAVQYSQLQATDIPDGEKIFIAVQPGSLVPKSPLLQRNEAMDLWSAGATDPISLYEDLKDPNPQERAKRLLMWKTAPQMLFAQDPNGGSGMPAMSPNDPNAVGGQPLVKPAPAGGGQIINEVPIQ